MSLLGRNPPATALCRAPSCQSHQHRDKPAKNQEGLEMFYPRKSLGNSNRAKRQQEKPLRARMGRQIPLAKVGFYIPNEDFGGVSINSTVWNRVRMMLKRPTQTHPKVGWRSQDAHRVEESRDKFLKTLLIVPWNKILKETAHRAIKMCKHFAWCSDCHI